MPTNFRVIISEDCVDNMNEFEERLKSLYWYERVTNNEDGYTVQVKINENEGIVEGTLPEYLFWFDLSLLISKFTDVERSALTDLKIDEDQVSLIFDIHPDA